MAGCSLLGPAMQVDRTPLQDATLTSWQCLFLKSLKARLKYQPLQHYSEVCRYYPHFINVETEVLGRAGNLFVQIMQSVRAKTEGGCALPGVPASSLAAAVLEVSKLSQGPQFPHSLWQ